MHADTSLSLLLLLLSVGLKLCVAIAIATAVIIVHFSSEYKKNPYLLFTFKRCSRNLMLLLFGDHESLSLCLPLWVSTMHIQLHMIMQWESLFRSQQHCSVFKTTTENDVTIAPKTSINITKSSQSDREPAKGPCKAYWQWRKPEHNEIVHVRYDSFALSTTRWKCIRCRYLHYFRKLLWLSEARILFFFPPIVYCCTSLSRCTCSPNDYYHMQKRWACNCNIDNMEQPTRQRE